MENKYILGTSHIKAFNYGFSFFLLGQMVPFIVEVFNYSFMLFVVTVDFFFF